MNIIEEGRDGMGDAPYVVGTPNATEDVYRHRRPGSKRAHVLRYFRFNLPRLTKAALLAVVALIGGCAAAVARSDHPPFPHAEPALWIVVAMAVAFLAFGLTTRLRIWDFGSAVAAGALIIYIGGIIGDAPYVWNGASVGLAATWNLMAFASLGYLALNWAVNFGMLVAWPDTQGFTD
ncbi:hypothetical protein [Corynebacterium sphenisci]|uniref:hypothetical protein n=1 Tax=Corynebacterium sphenisci TaxID=191493 RepID=UPI0026E046AF|nr:hypothetical protein [Corynebacterium sphenisci]MDO5731038.1 hypothetical protein [Corynebacterium sphenisci]